MWTFNDTGLPRIPEQASLLARGFRQVGLDVTPFAAAQVKRNIADFSETESHSLRWPDLQIVSPTQRNHLLGMGFALTAFLIAPLPLAGARHRQICSLGALLNLLVVVCDRLFDNSSTPHPPLTRAALAGLGDSGSLMGSLLREYHLRLQALGLSSSLLSTINQCLARMYDAESQTRLAAGSLTYRDWLRKSALPFVVMALPAWGIAPSQSRAFYSAHLRWLFQLGRFFGVVDDAVDFLEDVSNRHPNCWRSIPQQLSSDRARRTVAWGANILAKWDSMVVRTSESALLRDTFLYSLWEWLQPAAPYVSD